MAGHLIGASVVGWPIVTGEHALALTLLLALVAGGTWLASRRRLARRREAVAAWLRGGGEVYGGWATSRWDGPRVLRVRVEQAVPPFGALAVSVRIGPRGRVVVEATLSREPRAEFEIVYPGDPDGREGATRARHAGWRVGEVGIARTRAGVLTLAEPARGALAPREALLAAAARVEELWPVLRRVAVRRAAPHLVAVAALPAPGRGVGAQALFDLLREAAELALGSPVPPSPAPGGGAPAPAGLSPGPATT